MRRENSETAGATSADVGSRKPSVVALIIVVLLVIVAVLFVLSSLDRPELPTRAPDPPNPQVLGDTLVGPIVTTVDASDARAWVRFQFSRASVVEATDS